MQLTILHTNEVPTILPEVLQGFVGRHSPVAPPPAGRWRVAGQTGG